jgi:hypothetical protein
VITRLEGEFDDNRITRVLVDVEKGRRRLAEELEPVFNVFAYPFDEYDRMIA